MKKWIQPIQAATGNPDEVKKHGNAEVELDDIIDTNPLLSSSQQMDLNLLT